MTYNDFPDVIAPGGKGANQAVAASKAGAKTVILTRIGKDEIGNKILDNLNFYQVDTSNVEIVEGLENDYSNVYVRIEDKDNNIERFSGAINSFTKDIIDKYNDIILKSKIIVCQLKVPKEVTEHLINFCYKNDKILILTPCRPEKLSIMEKGNLDLIDKISIITCNKQECSTIFNTDDIESCIKKYPNKLIVTLGNEGLIYYNGNRIIKMPAIETKVIDTTGAGDTLNGNLSAFLSKGMDLEHALRKSMYASAMKLTTTSAQAGMPYLEDLENFIQEKRNKKFNYSNELNYALDIIKNVSYLAKYNTKYKISTKEDNTLVTNVDLYIENYLIKKIKEKFSQDNFVTEEYNSKNKLSDRTWIIDPIDGTAHFIKNDGLWGIQLAFYDKEQTRFSIIYLPDKKELYYAAENVGAFLNNNKILSKDVSPINQSIVEFGGSIYKEKEVKKMVFDKLINHKHLVVSNVLHINSCCISYTNLVSKKTDALIISTKKAWDIMPGEFLCKVCNIPTYYLDANKSVRLITNNNEIKELILHNK